VLAIGGIRQQVAVAAVEADDDERAGERTLRHRIDDPALDARRAADRQQQAARGARAQHGEHERGEHPPGHLPSLGWIRLRPHRPAAGRT
jgi:hypothetical protein